MGIFKIHPRKKKEHREGHKSKKEKKTKKSITAQTFDDIYRGDELSGRFAKASNLGAESVTSSHKSSRPSGKGRPKISHNKLSLNSSSTPSGAVIPLDSVREVITKKKIKKVHCAAPGQYGEDGPNRTGEMDEEEMSDDELSDVVTPVHYERTERARLLMDEPRVECSDERNKAKDEHGADEDDEEEEEDGEEEEEDIPDLEVTRCDLHGDVKVFVVNYIEENFEAESPIGSILPMVEELDKRYGATWHLEHISDEADAFQDKEAVPGYVLMYRFDGRKDYYVLYKAVTNKQPMDNDDDVDDYPD